ncbi:hypothetical protein KC319_g10042 [Hortaea werneckii]|nr:hypothetical protein KC317_g10406 [Hortaea werneckii]KAI7655296.1 hypothetical protein KC319_g10042 [Hortaea werneckii]KAI7695021.1 hypothetical protein KC322_g10221 [Hortaea werneckii]
MPPPPGMRPMSGAPPPPRPRSGGPPPDMDPYPPRRGVQWKPITELTQGETQGIQETDTTLPDDEQDSITALQVAITTIGTDHHPAAGHILPTTNTAEDHAPKAWTSHPAAVCSAPPFDPRGAPYPPHDVPHRGPPFPDPYRERERERSRRRSRRREAKMSTSDLSPESDDPEDSERAAEQRRQGRPKQTRFEGDGKSPGGKGKGPVTGVDGRRYAPVNW